MAEGVPEPEATAEKLPISEALRDAIGSLLNTYLTDYGLTVLSDFVLIAELIPGNPEIPKILRIIDSDLTPWARRGLLNWVAENDLAEEAGQHAWAMSLNDEGDDE